MIWTPRVTVAAVIADGSSFLVVEEETNEGLRRNQPAGHLDEGESLFDAVIRETLEETAWTVAPRALIGVYRWRVSAAGPTYLRFAFEAQPVSHDGQRQLDFGILRTRWMARDELAADPDRLRSPLVLRCIDDYQAGCRFPLDLLVDLPS